MHDQLWQASQSYGPIIALANHHGHALRPDVQSLIALDEGTRLREESPFTGYWAMVAHSYMVSLRSRFEVDLNRPRESAVYLTTEDAWGFQVWKSPPPDALLDASLAQYDAYYATLEQMCREKQAQNGRFVVLDLHSYNHRQEGPEGSEADPVANPEVNIGTDTLDRQRWDRLVDRFINDLRTFNFLGRHLDARENIKFVDRPLPKWVHTRFPETGCAIAIDFKKFFMNEWTGELDCDAHVAIKQAIAATLPGLEEELERLGEPNCHKAPRNGSVEPAQTPIKRLSAHRPPTAFSSELSATCG